MIIMSKIKYKCIANDILLNFDKSKILISFDDEQLNKIARCKFIEYKIKKHIITNIPSNIKSIEFTGWFNMDIQPYLHVSIEMLIFGHEFNQPIDNLPSGLKKLILGANFNQKVNNLPSCLLMLIIGGSFNQSVDMLPESIESISFSGCFNQKVNNLPSNIKIVRLFGYSFSQSIDSLPDSVEILEFNSRCNISINKLPHNLKQLKFINIYINKLPHNLQQLKFINIGNISSNIDCEIIKKLTNAKIKLVY